jgi:hypothetical protein
MRAVLRVAVHAIRARWRGWALLALLVAVGGGAVLVAAAGAWRTSSAYPRFLQASKASDVLVSPARTGLGGYYRALARLPGVAAVAPGVGLNIQPAAHGEGGSVAEVPADGQLWHRVDVPKVLAGRLPRADRAGEIAIDQNGAALLHLHVGSTLPMVALPNLPPGAKPGAVGRWAWALFSSGLGIPPGALIPVPFVLLMIPAALLAANAVAYWPARAAARVSPARVLRAE